MKHESKYVGSGMVDELECSCGWKSGPYFDGLEYANREFEKHVKDSEMKYSKFEVTMEDDDNGYEVRTTLKVVHDGKVLYEKFDGGEPEDNSFSRDWGWVPFAIEQAYELGFKDGQEK